MGTHGQAWQGMQLLVVGSTPLLPMKIEQAISDASPANEVKVDSFEAYEAAYDFCKQVQNVGFLILIDELGNKPIHDTFRQLAHPYEERGLPCFGVLLHEGSEKFVGYRALQICSHLLDYLPAKDFIDPSTVFHTLNTIWTKYILAFEQHVLPKALQDSILELVAPELSETDRLFLDRVTATLTANLNLSWLEMFALRWAPILEALQKTDAKMWETLKVLRQVTTRAKRDESTSILHQVLASNAPLCQRTSTLIYLVHESLKSGTLEVFLDGAKHIGKPGTPALIRHLSHSSDKIMKIADELQKASPKRQII